MLARQVRRVAGAQAVKHLVNELAWQGKRRRRVVAAWM
jgi:hypothetical protein